MANLKKDNGIMAQVIVMQKKLSDVVSSCESGTRGHEDAKEALSALSDLSTKLNDKGLFNSVGTTFDEYSKQARRTRSDPEEVVRRLLEDENLYLIIDLLHCAMGMVTEASEIMDHLKKVVFYGKELDPVNIAEEFGDSCWYMALGTSGLNLDFQTILEANIEKLKKRYPEKFCAKKAEDRNLEGERVVLEDNLD
jgi:NTP pyrophosphatase (non-canonical NTP hydrolase)